MNESQQLKKAGLKITGPRLKILQIFLESAASHHLSAEDIYKALSLLGEEVGLATVYRVLTQFEEAGLIIRHHFEGEYSVFELNQEGEHHDHVVCVKCGCVKEFLDELIEERLHLIAKEAGFDLTDHALNLYGLCPDCQKP